MKTTAGIGLIAALLGSTSSTGSGAFAPANYVAVTANTTAPAAGDTTLAGEITTASSGLLRGQAVYAYTGGSSVYTLTRTVTVAAADVPSLPVTLAKIGVFNASSGGTLAFESPLSPTVTLSAQGDSATITESVTIS